MDTEAIYYITGSASLLVLLGGYSARRRDWGIYLMLAGVIGLFATVAYGIHRAL